ncbi:MAG: hypothetical protein R6W89_09605 [Candidatus Hydrogenedentota bacterium]
MATPIRVTLWSGGKAVFVHYIEEPPQFEGIWCTFKNEDGYKVRLSGNISVEEGDFHERPISRR